MGGILLKLWIGDSGSSLQMTFMFLLVKRILFLSSFKEDCFLLMQICFTAPIAGICGKYQAIHRKQVVHNLRIGSRIS